MSTRPTRRGGGARGRLAIPARNAVAGGLLAAMFVLAGCETTETRPGAEDPENVTRSVNLSGFPPEFRRGFTDGCAAARAGQAGAPSGASGQYKVGWRDGFDYCTPQKVK